MSNDDLVKRYRALQEAIGGCGDGGCVIKRPQGQHTNGGCRCAYKPDHVTASRLGQIAGLAQKMADRIEALEKRVAELEAAMAWQPIETAPRDENTLVLLYVRGMVVCAFWNPKAVVRGPISHAGRVGCFYDPASGAAYPDATHWMPLPPAPEGEV